jgi:peptidoglycan/xylan/chitin deacetylase (PgdA/CDA1 family)
MGILKNIIYRVSRKIFLKNFRNQSIFPYYHLVSDNNIQHIENLYQYKNVEQFLYDIKLLTSNYKSLNPKDLFENKISKNSFLLTFDDGLQEVYTVIYPILKQNNISAIFFINPNFIDNKEALYKHYISIIISNLNNCGYKNETLLTISKMLSFSYTSVKEFKNNIKNIKFSDKDKLKNVLLFLGLNIDNYLLENTPYLTKIQIQEMIDNGFYFGGHTMSHPPLNQLDFDEQKIEIISSIEWFKINFGINYTLFAFPFTDKNITKKVFNSIFEYDKNSRIFGNSGIKEDFDPRIIQRFSLENPNKSSEKQIVTEHLYKIVNKLIGKYKIKRND